MTMTADSINADGARLLQGMSTTMHIKCLNDNSKQQHEQQQQQQQQEQHSTCDNVACGKYRAGAEGEGATGSDSYNKCHVKGSRATRRTSFSAARPKADSPVSRLQMPLNIQHSALIGKHGPQPFTCLSVYPTCGRG